MRVGEMMVVVRAEDFASRTLRRVGAEMMGLNRAQIIAAKREKVMRDLSSARHRVALAESNRRRLQYVKEGTDLRRSLATQVAAMDNLRNAQAKVMKRGRFIPGVDRATMQSYQNAAAAVRELGLEGAMAHRRLRAIEQVISKRRRDTGKAPTLVQQRESCCGELQSAALQDACGVAACRTQRHEYGRCDFPQQP
jgi:hypothetical protein